MEDPIRKLLGKITTNTNKIDELLSQSAQSESDSSDPIPQLRHDFSLHLVSLMKKLIDVNFELECELVDLRPCKKIKEPSESGKEPYQNCDPSKISTRDSGKYMILDNSLLRTSEFTIHIPERDEAHPDTNYNNTEAAPTEKNPKKTNSKIPTPNIQEIEQRIETVKTLAHDYKAHETVPQNDKIDDNNDKEYCRELSQNDRIGFARLVNAQNCFSSDDDGNTSEINYLTAVDTDDCQSCISSDCKESSSDELNLLDDPANNNTNLANSNTEEVSLPEKDNAVSQNVLTWMDKTENNSEVRFTNEKFSNRKMEALKELDSRGVLLVPQIKGLPVSISPDPVQQQERKYRREPAHDMTSRLMNDYPATPDALPMEVDLSAKDEVFYSEPICPPHPRVAHGRPATTTQVPPATACSSRNQPPTNRPSEDRNPDRPRDRYMSVPAGSCWNCGASGHARHDCRSPTIRFCSVCGKIGTLSRDCCSPRTAVGPRRRPANAANLQSGTPTRQVMGEHPTASTRITTRKPSCSDCNLCFRHWQEQRYR